MRLAVQQLLAGAPAAARAIQPAERVAEEFPVIPHIDTVFDPGLKLSHRATGPPGHRATGFGETAGDFYFELGASLMR